MVEHDKRSVFFRSVQVVYLLLRLYELDLEPLPPPLEPLAAPRLELVSAGETGRERRAQEQQAAVQLGVAAVHAGTVENTFQIIFISPSWWFLSKE